MTISDERLEKIIERYGDEGGFSAEIASIARELQSFRSQAGMGEAVAWISVCKEGRYQGEVEAQTTKPTKLPFNPQWGDWQPVYARPAPLEITEELVEKAAEAAITARIIPDSCQLMDYIDDLSAQDAVDLGVKLTEKTEDGKPRFHPLSYIREDEWRDVQMAIARPMVRAAFAFVFTQTDPDIVAATAKNRQALYEESTAALQGEAT